MKGFLAAFKTPDLRKKLLFTIGMIVIYRIGSFIPTPGVNYSQVKSCVNATGSNSDLLGLINLFSGGSLLQLSVFALGIMPYITASIIVQLLRVVIPRFEALHKEGSAGQGKLTQYTRYVTVGLAILQSTTIITTARTGALFGNQQECMSVIPDQSIITLLIMITCMTAGTSLIMWLGELITENGVGNGMSILIFASICSSFLPNLASIAQGNGGIPKFILVVVVVIAVIAVITYVEQSQRRVTVQYARRQIGTSQAAQSTYLPLKINMSGVIPVIFASSILAVPGLIAQFGDQQAGWVQWISANLSRQQSPLHMVLYALMIIFFCFFYTSITYNTDEVADNIKTQGGFIPGIRAGQTTSNYLKYILNRLNTVGSIYLAIVALIPTILFLVAGLSQSLPFGGTTILIIVGVGLDTVKQINSQLQQHHYEGFLGL
ncbi:MAG: preprotein translocase subunit SecY [Candidatus Ancillula sp.]|nr:preprotein translocase subunit SecY [Candidatus Ancillula sp.]